MPRFGHTNGEVVELRREGRTVIEEGALGDSRRELPDERAAAISLQIRIMELLRQHWVRHDHFADALVDAPEHELVAAAVRGEAGALDVYTDYLLAQGDPRGELAALRRATKPDEREIRALENSASGWDLFGPLCLAPRWWRQHFTFTWRDGWIERIEFANQQEMGAEIMEHALHAPMARFARALTVDHPFLTTLHECVHYRHLDTYRHLRVIDDDYRLLAIDLPNLKTIEVGEVMREEGPHGCRDGHPFVERLRVHAQARFPRIEGDWPALRHLELVWRGNTPRDYQRFLDEPAFAHLATITAPDLDPLLERFAAARGISLAVA